MLTNVNTFFSYYYLISAKSPKKHAFHMANNFFQNRYNKYEGFNYETLISRLL